MVVIYSQFLISLLFSYDRLYLISSFAEILFYSYDLEPVRSKTYVFVFPMALIFEFHVGP